MPRRLILGLGRACLPTSVVGFFHGAFQPHLDQMQHAPIHDASRERPHQFGVWNAPEVVREVGVYDFRMALRTASPSTSITACWALRPGR